MCDPVTLVSAAVAGIGMLTSAGATADNMGNIDAMNAAQQKQFNAQKAQTELQNQQQQRQILRAASTARAQGLSASVNQGAGANSSGILGAQGATTTDTGVAYNAVTQSNTNSMNIYDAEIQYSNAYSAYQKDNAIAGVGNAISAAAPALGRIGGTLFGGGGGGTSDWGSVTRVV